MNFKVQNQSKYTAIVWIGYLMLALFLTWPTISHLATYLPGDGGDDPAIAWNLWWFKYALLNEGQNPFQSNYMFYPIGINLAFYTLTPLNAATALPLTLNFGVVTASNLHMFFTFAAGGYGAFLLIRYLLAANLQVDDRLTWICAAIAGGFYAFASSKLFYVALGQFNIASNHWIPYTILYLLRAHHHPSRLKNSLMAGLFLTLQLWVEMTYASFLLIFMGLYWFYWILSLGFITIVNAYKESLKFVWVKFPSLIVHLRVMIIIGLTFFLGLTPILIQMLPDMQREGDFLVQGTGFAGNFSSDLLGYLIPTMHHPLLGNFIGQTNIADFEKGQHIYVGLVFLFLALVAMPTMYRRPALRFWLLATPVFALLCLGPEITINGQATGIKGPFSLLQSLPFFKGNRYPSRYSVMLLLCLSVLAGYGLVAIGRWLKQTRYASFRISITLLITLTLISGLFLFEHLSIPLPQSDMRLPTGYQLIANDPDDFTILEIPFAWRNGFRITGAQTTQFMFGQFYQTAHQKRLLQGNTSRNPEFKFQYFTNAPVINSLLALETGKTLPPERWQSDRANAADVLNFFNIKYIVVRPYHYTWYDGARQITVTPEAVVHYIEDLFPVENIYSDTAMTIYRVNLRHVNQSSLEINTHDPLVSLYFGEGWGLLSQGLPIAAQRNQTRLILPLRSGSNRITLRLGIPPLLSTGKTNTLHLTLNGWQSAPQALEVGWHDLTFEIPAGIIQSGLNDVMLNFDQIISLPDPFSNSITPVDITALSAGEEVGSFGHIYINGYETSLNQRGYNVVAIQSGLIQANFDTHASSDASAALNQFLTTITTGPPTPTAIVIAADDEASKNLTREAVLALQSIGSSEALRGCFRCSHAFINWADNSEPYIVEMLDSLRPVGITTRLGLTEPRIAALIDWIRIESGE